MAPASIADTTGNLFKLLKPLDTADRQRVIAAALTLLGDQASEFAPREHDESPADGGARRPRSIVTAGSEQSFFNAKDPQSKLEEFVVAARYRELSSGAHTHERDDLAAVIREARRTFDSTHYRRDIDNAKKAGYFNRGQGNVLSYYGQNYVDALPDREAAKALTRPKMSGRRRVRKKKANG